MLSYSHRRVKGGKCWIVCTGPSGGPPCYSECPGDEIQQSTYSTRTLRGLGEDPPNKYAKALGFLAVLGLATAGIWTVAKLKG